MGIRKVSSGAIANDDVYLLDDGYGHLNLHDHVHSVAGSGTLQSLSQY